MIKKGNKSVYLIFRQLIALLVLAAAALAGCQGESIIHAVFPASTDTEIPRPTPEPPESKEASQPTPTAFFIRDVVIWVPPQFDPAGNTVAARLLNQRLLDYQLENPQINIIVRVKAAFGPGGLLETLTNASTVAPESTPSLILLTRADMIQAISKNLLTPMDHLSAVIDEEDWYAFAQAMGIQQGTTYGLPFTSNLLGIVYRQLSLDNDQPDWEEVIRRFNQLTFPAGDPEMLIPISLYLSTGGELRDSQGHQMMDFEKITEVLALISEGSRRGLFPSALIDLQNDDQAWDIFQSGESDAIITWANRILNPDEPYQLAMLPTLGEQPYTTASGWLWCLSAMDEASQQEGAKLAEYLVAPEFLAEWSPNSGFFPVRPSSLNGWSDSTVKNTISRMLTSAEPRPIRQLTSAISPELKTSISEILTRQSTPAESAQRLIERLEVVDAQ